MTDVGGAPDARAEVREVLTGAVSEFGQNVLSSAPILEGICDDRLPDFPRECNLIVAAARADVRSMLDQQVGSVGADNAVRLTAGTLADSLSITPDAANWVVGEFARALGYSVSDVAPSPTSAPLVPPPAGERDTILPDAPVVVPGAPPPPVGVPAAPPSHVRARRRRIPVAVAVPVGIVVAAGVYLGIAAGVKIAPFARSSQPSASDQLMALIPSQIRTGFKCTPKANPAFGALAEFGCKATNTTPASIPPDGIDYYLFGTNGAMNTVYNEFLSQFAKVTQGAGDCKSFSTWAPGCETTYSPGANQPPTGHVVEYLYKGATDISTTVGKDNLLVDMFSGPNAGNPLVTWWAQVPPPWVTH